MPKISRVNKKKVATKPGDVPPERVKLDKYLCTRCGKIYKRQKGNFAASQSPLYVGNGGYLTICKRCLDDLYDHYKEVLGSGEEAMKRMCIKLDMYWHPDLYKMINKVNTSTSRVSQYISKTFLLMNIGKTYDDTLDEEADAAVVELKDVLPGDNADEDEPGLNTTSKFDIDADTVLFWGSGFDEDTYKELGLRFDRWTKDLQKPLPIVDEALYKQICIQEVMINRNAASGGGNIENGQRALNSLLSSLNVKPNQKKEENADLESTPLGVWAKRWEEKRPIPEYDPDMEDVHGLKKYITVWLYGHLGKSLGLKNVYSQMYEQEMNKYRVEKPQFEDEEDDVVISDMLGDSGGDNT